MKVKKVIVNIAFWLCILAAAGFVLYPNLTKFRARQQKQELLSVIQQQMKENARIAEHNLKIALQADIALEENGPYVSDDMGDNGETGVEQETDPESVTDSEPELSEAEQERQRTNAIQSILATQTVIGIIEMTDIDVLEPVVEGTGKENLKVAAGHVEGTAAIGQEGNCVVCAHNGGIYGKLFRDLRRLKNGNKVTITDVYDRVWSYEVYDSFTVNPEDVWILEDPDEEERESSQSDQILTLFTCENNGAIRRVLRCRLTE